MNTPTAYAKLKEKQHQEQQIADARNRVTLKLRKEEEFVLYEKIRNALKPYNKSDLDGHMVTVKNVPKEMKVLVSIDDYHYLTFQPERHYYSNHSVECDGGCSCEGSTWVTLDVTQHRKRKGDYGCYFECDEKNLNNDDQFAHAMAQMIRDFEWD